MSTFNETITLTNARDRGNAEEGIIPKENIRTVTLDACVDTGAWTLVINEDTRAKLGLELRGARVSTLADGARVEYPMTEPVELRWKDREYPFAAQVVPGADEVLFGALPLEALDLIVDPVDECVRGRHGDQPLHRLY